MEATKTIQQKRRLRESMNALVTSVTEMNWHKQKAKEAETAGDSKKAAVYRDAHRTDVLSRLANRYGTHARSKEDQAHQAKAGEAEASDYETKSDLRRGAATLKAAAIKLRGREARTLKRLTGSSR